MKYKNSMLLIFFLLGLGGLQAQQNFVAAGGEATSATGHISYSIGQIVYTTDVGSNGYSLAQGMEQSYPVSVVSGLEQDHNISLSVVAYPNPTVDYLTLQVNQNTSNLSFQLYNLQGKTIKSQSINGKYSTIKMVNLPTAIYFLKIIQGNKQVKIFKIIKK